MPESIDPNKPVFKELSGRIGRYEIVRLLGKGAMGQIYVAHDSKMDRDVALKVMAAQIADDPELKTRFEREAKEVGKITHRNLVTVLDFDYLADGSPYFAMELLKGQDLQKAMRQPPPMTLERKVAIIVQVLNGLNYAHERGIIHRDIKPANIFIQEDGSVKIMDFGVARLSGHTITADGNIVGTADYMSPEQVKGDSKKIGGRSDLFSVGCMLFELAAGRRPFHSDNLMAIFYKITHEEANFELIPQGEEYDALMPILKKALAKKIEQRYRTAYEFAMDLREWLKAHATTASSQNVLEALVDLEVPAHPALAATEAPGVGFTNETGDTVDVGRRGPRRGTMPPTRTGRGAAAGAGATRAITTPPVSRVPPRPRPAAKASVVPWVLRGVALVAVVAAGWLLWKIQHPAPTTAPRTIAVSNPTPAPAPVSTPTAPPATLAPTPTFEDAGGKAATRIRTAQAAFKAGNYDRAVAEAQEALREDPENAGGLKVLESARAGQQARAKLRVARAALDRGDFDAAEAELEAARRLAPWDGDVAGMSTPIAEARDRARREAEAKVQSEHTARINGLLAEASGALERRQYEAAIAAYGRVLELDPGNQEARIGRGNAVTARNVAAEAAAAASKPASAVRAFVAGRTEARASEQGGLVGFEDSAGIEVKRGTSAAELPGKVVFEAVPPTPRPGERFRVSAFLSNEGSQPIELATMQITTTTDGKPQRGFVSPATSTVAPGQKALVYQTPSAMLWREDTQSWTMEIVLTTTKGETYRNTLSWR